MVGSGDGAGEPSVPGHPVSLAESGAGVTVFAVVQMVLFGYFSPTYHISFLHTSFWEMDRYTVKILNIGTCMSEQTV